MGTDAGVGLHAERPYMKHKTTVQRFWPLPWDEKKEKRGADRVVMSREEQKRRFEELAKRG